MASAKPSDGTMGHVPKCCENFVVVKPLEKFTVNLPKILQLLIKFFVRFTSTALSLFLAIFQAYDRDAAAPSASFAHVSK